MTPSNVTVQVDVRAVSVVFSGTIKPYVRMTRRGKFVQPKALAYQASQDELKARFKEQLIEKGYRSENFPIFKNKQPLRAHVNVCVSKDLHTKDLDNQLKAVLDAAQGLLFENDLWIDTITAERSLASEDLVELVLLVADGNQDASGRRKKGTKES